MVHVVFLFPWCNVKTDTDNIRGCQHLSRTQFEKDFAKGILRVLLSFILEDKFKLLREFLFSFHILGASFYNLWLLQSVRCVKAVAQNLRFCRNTQWECWHRYLLISLASGFQFLWDFPCLYVYSNSSMNLKLFLFLKKIYPKF